MAEYALVGPADEIKTFSRVVKPDAGTKPGWRWLPVERSDDPYDPATEVPEAEVVTVARGKVTITRPARDKTPAELQAETDAEFDLILSNGIAAILRDLDNRLRALEGREALSADAFRRLVMDMTK